MVFARVMDIGNPKVVNVLALISSLGGEYDKADMSSAVISSVSPDAACVPLNPNMPADAFSTLTDVMDGSFPCKFCQTIFFYIRCVKIGNFLTGRKINGRFVSRKTRHGPARLYPPWPPDFYEHGIKRGVMSPTSWSLVLCFII